MALTGIEIYKKLPRTNCGECGVPTCMAFAMKLASGQAELSACPYVGEEAKAELESASAPPIRIVTVGTGDEAFKLGGETVLFRHEKTFINPPGVGVLITDDMSDDDIKGRIEKLNNLQYERVGYTLSANIAVIKSTKGDAGALEQVTKKVADQTQKPLAILGDDASVVGQAAKAVSDRKPLVGFATDSNADGFAELAKELGVPVVVKADGIDGVAAVTGKLSEAGIQDMIVDTGSRDIKQALTDQIALRRLSIQKQERSVGFPTMVFPCEMSDNYLKEAMYGAIFIAKYAGIIVLSDLKGETLFPLLVARMNIYTDPQRPMATTQGIYEINSPDENSPVLITSNFSLTYFIVSGELESSRTPAWLLVQDTEGLSVLTAWAAGKFVADAIGPFVKKSGIEDKIAKKRLIIPGFLASVSGELEEELPDWEIVIGPREASYIPSFVKQL